MPKIQPLKRDHPFTGRSNFRRPTKRHEPNINVIKDGIDLIEVLEEIRFIEDDMPFLVNDFDGFEDD